MLCERVVFAKRAGVQKQIEALASRQLAFFVLCVYARLAAPEFRFRALSLDLDGDGLGAERNVSIGLVRSD